jgi:tetratricopeptide (TPR) repeat protein
MPETNCQFKGTGGQYFGTVLIHLFLLSFITFGIYGPWAIVKLFRLKASHTTINGKPVTFAGTGGQLFGLMLVHGLLTFVTFGLYFPWYICKFFSWRAQNTLVDGKPSQFLGTGGSLFLFYLIHLVILPMLTLGLYYTWGLYRLYAWKEEHTRYGGEKTSFGAGFGGFLKVALASYILIPLTIYIFTPWAIAMLFRWQVNGLAVGAEEEIEHFPPVKTNVAVVAILILIGLTPFLALGLFIKSKYDEVQRTQSQMARMQMEALRKQKTYPISQKPAEKPGTRTVAQPAKPPSTPLPKAEPTLKEAVDYELEMRKINNLINLGSKNPDAFYNRGWLHGYKGNVQMAEKEYTKAIEINTQHADAYYNRGLVYVKMKKYEQAVRDFAQAINLDRRALDAYCNRGNANFQLGKMDLALRDLNAALRINPNDADLYYNRAVVYVEKGQNSKAEADFRRAARLGHNEAKKYLRKPPIKP